MMLSLLTVHFYYRYLSVTSPLRLSRFSMKWAPLWTFLVFANSAIWFIVCYFVNGPTPVKDETFRLEFIRAYCMQPEKYSYAGPQFFYDDLFTGETRIHIPSFFSCGVMGCIMILTISAITFFGAQTYQHINRLSAISRSENKELQKQLFKTLVIQTIIPIIFMYIPVTIMILLPIFGLQIESTGNFIPIAVAIYPCFEPLVAMVCIKHFRKRITGDFADTIPFQTLLICRLSDLQEIEENASQFSGPTFE